MKDWTGNSRSAHTMIGARNYAIEDRQANDFYATEPKALELLLEIESFSPNVWECACGEGHLAKVLEAHGYNVSATDLIDRGYGKGGVDFLKSECRVPYDGDIITNPPYKYGLEFVKHALELIADGHKVAMFLKLQFLEGKERRKFFDVCPPKILYVSSSRLPCAMNGDFERHSKSSAISYAWFIWEKGYTGDTVVKWFN